MVPSAIAPTIISSETFKVPPETSKVPPLIFNAAVLSLVSPKLTVPPSISRVPPFKLYPV